MSQHQQEMVYFDDGNVRISNISLLLRANGSSYPIGHLSQATLGEIAPQGGTLTAVMIGSGILLLTGGLCSMSVGFLPGESPMISFILSAFLLGPSAALLAYGFRRKPTPIYVALIKGSFGSVRAVSSPNRRYIENIVRVLHQAQAQAQRDQHGTTIEIRDSFNQASGGFAIGPNAQAHVPSPVQPPAWTNQGHMPAQGYPVDPYQRP